jgi:hypothetical protein
VWIRCIFYASRLLTDGVVPKAVFSRLGATKRVRDELLQAGLLEEHPDGVSVHDYLKFQDSRAQVESRRNATRERVTRHRLTHKVTPPVTTLPTPLVTPPTLPNSTEQRDLTCEGGSKDLTGQGDETRPEDTPAHVQRLERSFWPTVHLWHGPTEQHKDFARQNGLDLDVEARQYRANRRKCDFRCADFDADFEEWLAKSLKLARGKANGAALAPVGELSQRDREELEKSKARLRRKGVIA